MRNIKIISIMAIVIFMITSQSCKKGLLEGVNDDPNSPLTVTPRVLLPGAEGSLAYSQGGDVERFTSIMVQNITGFSRQFGGYQNYSFTEEDFNNLWYNLYAATMENFKTIVNIDTANPGFYTIYGGIAKIQLAYTLGMTTDLWGDIPYNDAFLGNANLTPAYQPQQEIYDTIQSLLTQGIDELTNDPGTDLDVPTDNDFIYSGDVPSWIAFAHALKARFYLHLTKVDGNNGATAAQQALDEINAGGVISTAAYPFSATGQSPWYQYITQRDDITYSAEEDGVGNTLTNTMSSRGDPRYPVYIDVNGDFFGVGYLNAFFGNDASSVYLMTTSEQYFIEAEAKLRLDDQAGAQSALINAINEDFTMLGLNPGDSAETAYVATYATLTGDFNADLQTIITEKWIANYLHPESWVDYRRTGYPALTPNSGSEIPRRFIYPTDERLYNPNSINQNSDMFQPRLWWDQ
jgi:hypothetical protein